jgi:hypothetical protein
VQFRRAGTDRERCTQTRKEFFKMKKNIMMRIASVLLIVTLASTCVISGTFAKYVTTSENSQSARVAKWGVTLEVNGGLFGTNYNSVSTTTDNPNKIAVGSTNVSSTTTENVVAPGTEGNTLSITTSGTSEVAYTLSVVTTATNQTPKEIFLSKGDYGVMEKVTLTTNDSIKGYYYTTDDGKTFTQATADTKYESGTYYKIVNIGSYNETDKYYPLTWKVTGVDNATTLTRLDAIATAIAGKTQTVNAGTTGGDLGITLTWSWDFDDSGKGTNDVADTILGKMMAAKADGKPIVVVSGATVTAVTDEQVCLDVYLYLEVSATQID